MNLIRTLHRHLADISKQLTWQACHGKVLQGPFRGMHYPSNSVGSAYKAKLMGTYEMELHPVLADWGRTPPLRLINVGSAEGYYSVGLARFWGVPVLSYELDPFGRQLLDENIRLNRMDHRVANRGEATLSQLEEDLRGLAPGQGMVLCDIEGGEKELLDVEAVPSLRSARILVELHEYLVPGIGTLLHHRFNPTHHIAEIPTRARSLGDFPADWPLGRLLPAPVKLRMMAEHRPTAMQWLAMVPRPR